MPAGLQIINNFGSVLIDENYSNLAMAVKNEATTSGGTLLNNATVALSGLVQPMVAFGCDGRYVTLRYFSSSLSSMLLQADGPGSAVIKYYIFDLPTPSATHGLQVFNAAGQMVFDSGNKYARVVDVFGGSALADWTPLRTYASGRAYAVVMLRRAYRKEVENLGGGNWLVKWYTSGIRISSNTVQGKMIQYKEDTVTVAPVGAIDNYAAQFAVIDVTNY